MAGYSVTFEVVDHATKHIEAINKRLAQMRAPMERMSKQVQEFVDVSGLSKVADGFAAIHRSAVSVLDVFTRIVPALGFITSAATVAGMGALVNKYAEWAVKLGLAATSIGTTTDTLQRFQDASRRAGGSAEEMTNALRTLHEVSAGARAGTNTEAIAYFQRFGIAIEDANGKLRPATDLLRDVFHALDTIRDPADRARVATALLGDAQAHLYETMRSTGQSLEQRLALEDRHLRATNDQIAALQRYASATDSLGVTFDQLGRQIGATLATHLAPLIEKFDKFVTENSPAIVAAVDRIAARFAAWLEGITWEQVEAGIKRVTDALYWVVEHLDTIILAIEIIAALFAAKWAIGIIASIASVISSLTTATVAIATYAKGWGAVTTAAKEAEAAQLAASKVPAPPGGGMWSQLGKIGLLGALLGQVAQDAHGDFADLKPDDPRWRLLSPEQQRQFPNSPLSQQQGAPGAEHETKPQADQRKATEDNTRKLDEISKAMPLSGFGGISYRPPGGGMPGIVNASYHPGEGGGFGRSSYGGGAANTNAPAVSGLPGGGPAGGQMPAMPGGGQSNTLPGFSGAGLPPEMAQLPGDTSWGDYGTRANNPGNMNFAPGQGAAGRFSYTDPQTGGRHTMGVFSTMQQGVAAAYRLMLRNQGKYGQTIAGALHGWAENSYIGPLAQSLGMKPGDKFDLASADPQKVAELMRQQFVREGRRGSHTASSQQILEGVNLARGGPANSNNLPLPQAAAAGAPAAPPASATVNGQVDVSVTHVNPPPNASVTARGSGAVNVAPPRTERTQVDMASI